MHLHYASAGAGPATIALTHGLAADSGTWSGQIADLARIARVITWDLRGHGQSDAPEGPYVLADLAADLRAVLDRAGVARAVVLGHSAGGVIALRFALDFPDRCAGLVLVGTASECNERAFRFYEELATLAEQGDTARVHKRLGLPAPAPDQRLANPAAFAKVARCMGNLHREPLTPELDRIRCPTLILVGEKDFLGAGGSVILSRRIAGSRLEIVPGRGHGIFLEDPAGFNRMVGEFIASLVH
jgi:pimeloyl-ACP methyl ester carboxylesterase